MWVNGVDNMLYVQVLDSCADSF